MVKLKSFRKYKSWDKISDFTHAFQASGKWTGEEPHCESFSTAAIIIFTVATLTVLILIVCLGCCFCSQKIRIGLFMKFGASLGQRLEMAGKLYDVYVMHDQDGDWQFVENKLIPVLQENKLKVANTECSTLGKDVFSALEVMLKHSKTILVVITQKFLKAPQNLYYLKLAIHTQSKQENFKIVFLLCQKVKTLGKLPEYLSLFLKLGTTIKKYKGNWQNSLVYEVIHKTHPPLSKRLSFRNKLPKIPNNLKEINVPSGIPVNKPEMVIKKSQHSV